MNPGRTSGQHPDYPEQAMNDTAERIPRMLGRRLARKPPPPDFRLPSGAPRMLGQRLARKPPPLDFRLPSGIPQEEQSDCLDWWDGQLPLRVSYGGARLSVLRSAGRGEGKQSIAHQEVSIMS